MLLAPAPTLAGRVCYLADGGAGVFQTLRVMRSLVRHYRTDPVILQAARSLIFLTPERSRPHEVAALFNFVRDTIRYVQDVHEVETLSTPVKTLHSRVGDCDDQVTLLATLLESVGYPTRFVMGAYTEPGAFEHVYMQAMVDGEWIDMDPTEREPLGWAPPGALTLFHERV